MKLRVEVVEKQEGTLIFGGVNIGAERWRELHVYHNGELIAEEADRIPPEDVAFTRDLKWIAPLLQQVYELGVQDGKLGTL